MTELKKHIHQKIEVKKIFVNCLETMISCVNTNTNIKIRHKHLLLNCINSYPISIEFEKYNSNMFKVKLTVTDKIITSTLDITEKTCVFRMPFIKLINGTTLINSNETTNYLIACKNIVQKQINELDNILSNFDVYINKTNEIINLIEKYKQEVPLAMRISIQYDKKVLF